MLNALCRQIKQSLERFNDFVFSITCHVLWVFGVIAVYLLISGIGRNFIEINPHIRPFVILSFLGASVLGFLAIPFAGMRVNPFKVTVMSQNFKSLKIAENPIVQMHSAQQVDEMFYKKHIAWFSPYYEKMMSVLCCVSRRDHSENGEGPVLPMYSNGSGKNEFAALRHKD